jgi:hypothetical protein
LTSSVRILVFVSWSMCYCWISTLTQGSNIKAPTMK